MAETSLLSIAIDPRKNRIRIHKPTLHALGDPKWIQLLFNANDLVLVIRAAEKKQPGGHEIRVRPREICGQDFELHSSLLIDHFVRQSGNMSMDYTYRLTGEYSETNRAIFFPFSTMTYIENR